MYILGLLIVLAGLHREQPGDRLPWLVGSYRLSGPFVLCCVLFAPSPLGDNSHSAASSSAGQGPRKFISSAPSQVECWSTDLRASASELRRPQSHQPIYDLIGCFFFSSTGNIIVVVGCVPSRCRFCVYSGNKYIKRARTDSLFSKHFQEAFRRKMAPENCSF